MRFAAMAATPDVASISRGIAFSLMGYPAGLQPLAEKTNALLPQLLASAQLSGMVMAITVDFPTEEVGRTTAAAFLLQGVEP